MDLIETLVLRAGVLWWGTILLGGMLIILTILQVRSIPNVVRILVLGMDRDPTPGLNLYRNFPWQVSDAMFVVQIDRQARTAILTQIPRDTMAFIPTRLGWDKVNTSIAEVGAEQTCGVVGELINRKIAYYVVLTIPDVCAFFSIVKPSGTACEQDIRDSELYLSLPTDLQQSHDALLGILHQIMARPHSDVQRQNQQRDFLRKLLESRHRLGLLGMWRLAVWARCLGSNMPLVQASVIARSALQSEWRFGELSGSPIHLNTISYMLPAGEKAE